MKDFFSPDSSAAHFLSTLFDLIVLNLSFIVCCIPIITIGASITALLRQTFAIVRQEGTSLRAFFTAFWKHLKPATIIWVAYLVITFLVVTDIQLLNRCSLPMESLVLGVVLALYLVCSMVMLYIFPLLARFRNTLKNYVVCAFFLALSHLPTTICLLFLHGVPVVLFLTAPTIFLELLPLMATIVFSAISLATAYLMNRCFKKSMPSEP